MDIIVYVNYEHLKKKYMYMKSCNLNFTFKYSIFMYFDHCLFTL